MNVTSETTYKTLRDRIFDGHYAPGSRLKEREICADLKVSRTPVREALHRLDAEGLVDLQPRRGGVVIEIGPAEAAEIFALGAVLESYAAKLAAQRAQPVDVDELDVLLNQMEQTLANDNQQTRVRYMTLDSNLHGKILEMAASPRLSNALQQTANVPILVQAFQRYSIEDLKRSYEQHRNIVGALRAGDRDWAESAMRCHILAGRGVMLPED